MFSSVFYEFSLLNIAIITLVFLYVPMPFCKFTRLSLFIFAIACRLCAYISLTTFTSWYFRRGDRGFAFGAVFTAAIFCFYRLVVAFKTLMLCVSVGNARGTFVSCIRACRVLMFASSYRRKIPPKTPLFSVFHVKQTFHISTMRVLGFSLWKRFCRVFFCKKVDKLIYWVFNRAVFFVFRGGARYLFWPTTSLVI